MDAAEAHAQLTTATGAAVEQPAYREPPTEVVREPGGQPEPAQTFRHGDPTPTQDPIVTPSPFGELLGAVNAVAATAGELVELLGALVDAEGRPIWMTAEEVELDQWVVKVALARDELVERLR